VEARNLHVREKEDDDEINSSTAGSEKLARWVAGVGLFKKALSCELPELLPEFFWPRQGAKRGKLKLIAGPERRD
jgi:hypothetical protein